MSTIVIVTSVINISSNPLSYTPTRSVFTHAVRFAQTKHTIATIRDKIPNSKILLVECSPLDNEQIEYLSTHVDYFVDTYSSSDVIDKVNSPYKGLGENTLLLEAFTYLKQHNIQYTSMIKLSGRYALADSFSFDDYSNHELVYYKRISDNDVDIYTSFYKIPMQLVERYELFIRNHFNYLYRNMAAEIFFGHFLKNMCDSTEKCELTHLGVGGNIAVFNGAYSEI